MSFDIHEGEILALLGRNGAGKTSTLRAIARLDNPALKHGEIWLDHKPLHEMKSYQAAQAGIALVPEDRRIIPGLTVEENLALGAYTRSDKAEIARDRDMVFSYFPILSERRKQEAGTLSGGQQQMLAIGRGLMLRPKIMLLDEPSLGLSPILTQEIFAILKKLNQDEGVTMMLVEQNAAVALDLADDGYVLELGRIVMSGSADKLANSDDIKSFYLGHANEGARGERRWKRRKTWR